MKILMIAPYSSNDNVENLSKCKAGFGYMVYDITSGIAKYEEVEMLLYNYRYNNFFVDNIYFIGSSFGLFFKYLVYSFSFFIPCKLMIKYKMSFRLFVRVVYFWLISGYYYHIIKYGNYDIVHVHGCGFFNSYIIDICKRLNQKVVFTLHGLNSFSDSVKLEAAGKKYERDFLKKIVDDKYEMSVISTGIKKKILKYMGKENINNIKVICNAFNFE